MAENITYEITVLGLRGDRDFVLTGTIYAKYDGTLLFTEVDGSKHYFPKAVTMINPIKD